jgi:hypothetical protein
MRRFWILAAALTAIITGCSQGASASAEDIAKLAYEWEKAYFDTDYSKEQELLYEPGSFEVHKSREKKESGLKFEDIRYEIYYDNELEQYYVFTDFKSPTGANNIKDELLIRKKGDEWKVDKNESFNIVRKDVSKKFEREACIHCK